MNLIRQWLEIQGYGVIETGWTRSELVADTIGTAKAGNTLNHLTFSLLYATDFADRLEKVILPALRSGFVVLADRYVYTAFARSIVRGADPKWIQEVFGFALVPDLTIYMKVDVGTLISRVFSKQQKIDYWEAGMDMHFGTDVYESFHKYQTRLIGEYNRMAKEFGFVTVDGRLSVETVDAKIRKEIERLISRKKMPARTEILPTTPPAPTVDATDGIVPS
jgi:dTMP kinase